MSLSPPEATQGPAWPLYISRPRTPVRTEAPSHRDLRIQPRSSLMEIPKGPSILKNCLRKRVSFLRASGQAHRSTAVGNKLA